MSIYIRKEATPLSKPYNITATGGYKSVSIKWNDPQNNDDVRWVSSTLVRSTVGIPADINDGTVVVTSTTRNQYSSSGYVDSGLTAGTTYYYNVFVTDNVGNIVGGDGASGLPNANRPVVDVVVVGGGGGGGYSPAGGGGGGGGVVECYGLQLTADSTSVVVGAGGCTCCAYSTSVWNGGNSSFGNIIAYGGGYGGGGARDVAGNSGGSGGGGGASYNSSGTTTGGNGTAGQGCKGGIGMYMSGGGGGGAGAAGQDAHGCCAGNGGAGKSSTIGGSVYGGGGGAMDSYYGCCGAGGSGGGGKGGYSNCNATSYGGGGGGTRCARKGGYGYQGIVIVRYPTSCGYDLSGGTKTTSGSYTKHTFTANGSLVIN